MAKTWSKLDENKIEMITKPHDNQQHNQLMCVKFHGGREKALWMQGIVINDGRVEEACRWLARRNATEGIVGTHEK